MKSTILNLLFTNRVNNIILLGVDKLHGSFCEKKSLSCFQVVKYIQFEYNLISTTFFPC